MLAVVPHLLEKKQAPVKVRIKRTPREHEIDGVSLKDLRPGAVRDVSPELGTWLIVEEYADSEMRQTASTDPFDGYFNPAPRSSTQRERRGQKR